MNEAIDLHTAAREGDVKLVEHLIEQGALISRVLPTFLKPIAPTQNATFRSPSK